MIENIINIIIGTLLIVCIGISSVFLIKYAIDEVKENNK
jgi:hypothetical protein